MRERINKIFSNRAIYVAVSIVAAFTLWVYVTNVDNQNMERTIFDIKVNFTGKETLLSKGYVIDDSDNYSVSLTLLGRRDAILKLKNSNIDVNVDVSDLASSGTFARFYTVALPSIVNYNDVYILKKNPEYVNVKVNKFVTKSVNIKGSFAGTLKPGYEAKSIVFSQDTISVSGPEPVVSRIAYAEVKIRQNEVDKTINQSFSYVLTDNNGSQVPMDGLIVNVKSVEATMPVVMVKKVPLTIKLNAGGGAAEKNVKYSVEPQTITLSGDPEAIEKISEISLKTYNIGEIVSEQSEYLNIPIPEGTVNVSEVDKAKVSVSVVGLNTRSITVSNIKITNVYTGHKATLVTKEFSVTLRGEPAALDAINPDNVTVILDLTQLGQSVGRYSVPAKIEVSGTDKVGAIGSYTAIVTLEGA